MSSRTPTLVSTADQFEHSLLTAWLDSPDVGLRAIDYSVMVVMLYQAACATCGVLGTEVLRCNCRFLQGNGPHQQDLAAIRIAINNQTNGYAKLQNFRKAGCLFSNKLLIPPVKDASGMVTYFVGIHPLEASQVSQVSH